MRLAFCLRLLSETSKQNRGGAGAGQMDFVTCSMDWRSQVGGVKLSFLGPSRGGPKIDLMLAGINLPKQSSSSWSSSSNDCFQAWFRWVDFGTRAKVTFFCTLFVPEVFSILTVVFHCLAGVCVGRPFCGCYWLQERSLSVTALIVITIWFHHFCCKCIVLGVILGGRCTTLFHHFYRSCIVLGVVLGGLYFCQLPTMIVSSVIPETISFCC